MQTKEERLAELRTEEEAHRKANSGENHKSSKLDNQMARAIHVRIDAGEADKSIAKDFPVCASHIALIRRGGCWKKEDICE